MAATALPADIEKQRMEDMGISSYTSYSINKATEIKDRHGMVAKLL